ncbi:MAG: hypothetical protein ACFBSE_26705 [Prochloraceae cyanobacterium]
MSLFLLVIEIKREKRERSPKIVSRSQINFINLILMISQIKIERNFLPRELTPVNSKTSDQLPKPKKVSKAGIKLVLVQLSRRHRRYAVELENERIGIIKPGIRNWIATADLQFGATESQEKTPTLALNWLLQNYKRVKDAGISFFASVNLMHYNIENENWLIKIDCTPYEYLAKINHENNLYFEYFPDIHSAVVFSFDLIFYEDKSNCNTYNDEF